ncbi:hypothetical protein [Salipiger bermudensis]|uniref:hypothetical protein n=1 Tax=Salipiger bermudensis TaxID=344736 RepID=UPI001CD7D816|nr:hypothetical protein [Salipiger bermudensis]MCA0961179.1 hypothetical protein [Salipiger bermudensis]
MPVSLSQVIDGAENGNDRAEAELWARFRAVRPLDALMITDHDRQTETAIAWAKAQMEDAA